MKAGQSGSLLKEADVKGKRTSYGTIQLPQRNKISFWKLFSSLGICGRLNLTFGVFSSICHGSVGPLLALVFGMMTNSLVSTDFTGHRRLPAHAQDILAAYIVLTCATFVLSTFQAVSFEIISDLIVYRLRLKFLRSVFVQQFAWHEKQKEGSLTLKFSENMDAIKAGTGLKASLLIQNVAALVCGCAVSFSVSWELSLLSVLLTAVLLYMANMSGKLSVSAGGGEQHRLAKANHTLQKWLAALSAVITFGGEDRVMKDYERTLEEAAKSNEKGIDLAAIGNGSVNFVTYISYGLILWVGSVLFVRGLILPGYIFTVIFIGMGSATAVRNILTLRASVTEAKTSAFSVFEVIESPKEISLPIRSLPNTTLKGKIQFKEVHFTHHTKTHKQVLTGVALDVAPGTNVGIVGENGSGKTTLLMLLLRFYSPSIGKILLDGMDLQEFPPDYVRSQFGVVAQHPKLFPGTIRENIAMGGKAVSVLEAGRQAYADEFISLLPEKYDTKLGERGMEFSTSRKQLIALARALASQPRVLILDNPTANVEPHSQEEETILQALRECRKSRTTVTLTDNPVAVQGVDVIHFLKGGQIVESGMHEELMLRKGLYFQYVQDTAQKLKTKRNIEKADYTAGDSAGSKMHQSYSTPETFSERDLLRLLCTMMRLQWPSLVLGITAAGLLGTVQPFSALIYGEAIRVFSGPLQQVSSGGIHWALAFLLLAIFAAMATALQTRFLGRSSELIGKTLRVQIIRKILSLPLPWFEAADNYASIQRKLSRDVGILRSAYTLRTLFTFVAIVTVVCSLGLAYASTWRVAILLTFALPLLVFGSFFETMTLRASKHHEPDSALRVAIDALDHVQTVQSLVAEGTMLEHCKSQLLKKFRKSSWRSLFYGITFGFSESALCLVYCVTFYFGTLWLEDNLIQLPGVYKAFLAVVFAGGSVGQILSLLPGQHKAREAAATVFRILETKSKIDPLGNGGARPNFTGHLVLDNVYFKYPGDHNPLFKGLSLSIEEKKTLGLFTDDGSGKTTLCKLIKRLYDVDDGAITIDGWDVRDVNVSYLRANIGLVSEDVEMINATILENIEFGAPGHASFEAVRHSAVMANAHDFISKLPQGYETVLGVGGFELSGSEKIRIGIARALIRNPKVLLLDLALHDVKTVADEKAIQISIDAARKDRTTLIISNRISILNNSDAIGVLRKGSLVEFLTHEAWVARRGLYHSLIDF